MSTFREEWIGDGFPWCDNCGQPCVFNEQVGNMHVTEEQRWGVRPHADQSGHVPTMKDWAEEGRRWRADR